MLNNSHLVGIPGLGCRAWSSSERAGHPFPSKEQDKRMLTNE